jgi:hypothetical protein
MTKTNVRIPVAIATLLLLASTVLPQLPPNPKPAFTMSVDRQMNGAVPGTSATYKVYLTPVGAFVGTVVLDCDMSVPYEGYSISPSQVRLGPMVAAVATITIRVKPGAPEGMTHFMLHARATGPTPTWGDSHSMPLHLMVIPK